MISTSNSASTHILKHAVQIDVGDVVTLIQIILADERTTSSTRQQLQKQLSRLDGLQQPSLSSKLPDTQQSQGQCRKGYIWNGTECVSAFQQVYQWSNEWHVAPVGDLEGGHIQWSDWPWMMSVKAPYTLSLWIYMTPENDMVWINVWFYSYLTLMRNK